MPRPRLAVPTYRLHKPSGKAVVTVRTPSGQRRDIVLGVYGSPESKAAYVRVCATLEANGTEPAIETVRDPDVTVTEVVVAFMKHALDYYRNPDGTHTSEVSELRAILRPFRQMFGTDCAGQFGPRALIAFRATLIEKGWCRTLINRRIDRIKRAFKWAVAQELVPPSVYEALRAVEGLRAGRSAARESAAVVPVPVADYERTLPHLPPHVRALVQLLRLTGMRPSEACRLTVGQLDRSGDVWAYSPTWHKTAHRGKRRRILFGPAAQQVLADHLAGRTLAADDPVFSPAAQREERFAELRKRRQSKVPPSQRHRRKAKPVRRPGRWFTPHAVAHAVRVAATKAGVPHWHPYQLRHRKAVELRERFGLEHVRAVLGQSHASVAAHYAVAADATLATEAATKDG